MSNKDGSQIAWPDKAGSESNSGPGIQRKEQVAKSGGRNSAAKRDNLAMTARPHYALKFGESFCLCSLTERVLYPGWKRDEMLPLSAENVAAAALPKVCLCFASAALQFVVQSSCPHQRHRAVSYVDNTARGGKVVIGCCNPSSMSSKRALCILSLGARFIEDMVWAPSLNS